MLTHWSYVFLALTHRCVDWLAGMKIITQGVPSGTSKILPKPTGRPAVNLLRHRWNVGYLERKLLSPCCFQNLEKVHCSSFIEWDLWSHLVWLGHSELTIVKGKFEYFNLKRKVCHRFDTGCGLLYMAIPSELRTAKDRCSVLHTLYDFEIKNCT